MSTPVLTLVLTLVSTLVSTLGLLLRVDSGFTPRRGAD